MFQGVKMNVISTAPNGVVNSDTIFRFTENEGLVSANYAGGKIKKGYLLGNIQDGKLHFSYCQVRYNGKMDHGTSVCEISHENDKLILKEKFEMSTEKGKEIGINVFKELPL